MNLVLCDCVQTGKENEKIVVIIKSVLLRCCRLVETSEREGEPARRKVSGLTLPLNAADSFDLGECDFAKNGVAPPSFSVKFPDLFCHGLGAGEGLANTWLTCE